MSVIAVEGLSQTVTLNQVDKLLSKSIQGEFKPLNFMNSDCNTFKTCYVQLSEDLNPMEVIESINKVVHGRRKSVLKAYMSDTVPKFPPKPVFLHKNLRRKLGIPAGELTPKQILSVAHLEIMTELQFKYPLLCDLSGKSSHRLLEGIGMTVQERLEKIMGGGGEHTHDPRSLTERYRELHPHDGDFELIRNTLHWQQDAAGEPLTPLQELELALTFREWKHRIYSHWDCTGKIETLSKYNNRIAKKIERYVQNYDLTPNPEDSKEERARKAIRAELAQTVGHLPAILYEMKLKHFPKARPPDKYEKIRMYGEPCLPPEHVTHKLFQRYRAQRISRRKTMYNLVVFDVPVKTAPKVMELDGQYWGGSKLVIRSTYVSCHLVTIKEKNAVKECTQIDAKQQATSSTAQ